MLTTRLLTAAVLIVVVATVGYLDNFTLTWLFFGIVALFAFHEALRLFEIKNSSLYLYALLLWLVAYLHPYPEDLFFLAAVVVGATVAYRPQSDAKLLLPFLYPLGASFFFLALYEEVGMEALVWLLIVVASTDTFAYFVGKAIGKRKFSDTSPNKTIEGVAGGVLFATLFGTLYGTTLFSLPIALIVSLLSAVASVFGDLFESYLKRRVGLKDSGDLLPGHGGVLDRIDGYLFAAPVMTLLVRLFA